MSTFHHTQYDYRGVQGDKIPIQRTLETEDGGTVDLTGRTATLVVRHLGGAKVASAEMSIDDETGGVVSYDLTSEQTSRHGLHKADVELTGGDDDPTTLPADEALTIYLREDVAHDDDVTEPLPDDLDGATITPGQVGTEDNRTDVYGDSVHSRELSTRESNNVYVADPTATDIGAEIQSIHDNKCDNGDTIYVPPGAYHNQQTGINLTKWVNLVSEGGWRNPGAEIYKQGDFVALTTATTGRPSGAVRGNGGHKIQGIRFDGEDVTDTSAGIVIHSVVTGEFSSQNHGTHGVFFEHATDGDDISNWSDVFIEAYQNGSNGVHIEQTGGDVIGLNDMNIRVNSRGNDGAGIYHRDGYDNNILGDCEGNGGAGWDLGGRRLWGVTRDEQNGALSSLKAVNSVIFSKSTLDRWDHTQTGLYSYIQRGTDIRGRMELQGIRGDIANGNSLTNIPLQDGDKEIIDSTTYRGANKSTTATSSYEGAYQSVQERGIISDPFYEPTDYSTYYIRLVSVLYNDTTGETVSHRIKGFPSAECVHTGDGDIPTIASPLVERSLSNNPSQFATEISVSGGTGHVYATKVELIGEI